MNDVDDLLRDAGARLRDTAPSPAATEAALATLADVPLDATTPTTRRRLWIVGPAIMAAAAVTIGVVVASGPDRDAIVPADTTVATTAPTPSSPPTTVPATAPTPSTSPAPPSTVVTTQPPAAAWSPDDGAGFVADACCGSPAQGPASPELTTGDQPLADGRYPVEVVGWSADDPTRLELDVHRFVPCATGLVDCTQPGDDGTFPADAFGRSDESRPLTVTLDGSVRVVVAGIDVAATRPDTAAGMLRRTDGTTFAGLLADLATSYDDVFGAPLAAGGDPEELLADITAAPRDGFTSARADRLGDVYFTSGDAPGLLLQSISDQGAPLARSGTSGIDLGGVTVADGVLTLYYVAGFRS
jgi:hypothetical protein